MMEFIKFLFRIYNLIIISLLMLSSLTTSAQELDSVTDPRDMSPLEFYDYINGINSYEYNTDRSLQNYSYQLDSVFSSSTRLFPNDPDSKSYVVYRYNIGDNIDISFHAGCLGTLDCTLMPSSVISRQYNDNDQLVGLSGNRWDGITYSHTFELPHDTQYIYTDGLLTSILSGEVVKDSLVYNEDRNLERVYHYFKYDHVDTFMLDRKYFYKYNDQQQLENILFWEYRANFGGFIPLDSTVFEYNNEGELAEEVRFLTVQVNPLVLEIFDKRTYKYRDNLCAERVFCHLPILEGGDTIWRRQEQTIYNYHPLGSLETVEYFDIRNPNDPIPIFLTEYEYDRTILAEDILFPRFRTLPSGHTHMLVSQKNTLLNNYPHAAFNDELDPLIREYYYKPRNAVSTTDISHQVQVTLTPNPVSDILTLQMDDVTTEYNISIYDSAGRPHIIRQSRAKAIDVSSLPTGTYHYTISAGQKVGHGTFVKM